MNVEVAADEIILLGASHRKRSSLMMAIGWSDGFVLQRRFSLEVHQ